jgi:hypothetical protein
LLDYGSPGQSADVFRGLVRANNRDAEAYSGLGAAEFAGERYRRSAASGLDPAADRVLAALSR